MFNLPVSSLSLTPTPRAHTMSGNGAGNVTFGVPASLARIVPLETWHAREQSR